MNQVSLIKTYTIPILLTTIDPHYYQHSGSIQSSNTESFEKKTRYVNISTVIKTVFVCTLILLRQRCDENMIYYYCTSLYGRPTRCAWKSAKLYIFVAEFLHKSYVLLINRSIYLLNTVITHCGGQLYISLYLLTGEPSKKFFLIIPLLVNQNLNLACTKEQCFYIESTSFCNRLFAVLKIINFIWKIN